MKSEMAAKYIENDTIQMRNGDRIVDASTAYIAIELAEQEAEDRMQEKAICTFCEANCQKGCSFGSDIGCGAKERFIQKLKEYFCRMK